MSVRIVPPGEPSQAQAPAATVRPGYKTLVERQTAKPQERFTPCNLVTRSEAQRILRKPVQAPYEAPQGPTCLYRPRAAGDELVGLTVLENQGLESIRARNDRSTSRTIRSAAPGPQGQDGFPSASTRTGSVRQSGPGTQAGLVPRISSICDSDNAAAASRTVECSWFAVVAASHTPPAARPRE